MAHYYGKIKGQRETTITKCGTKKSGMTATICAWNSGIRAVVERTKDGKDKYSIFRIGGSNNEFCNQLIGEYIACDAGAWSMSQIDR